MDHLNGIRLKLLLIVVIGVFCGCSDSTTETTAVEVLTTNPPVISRLEPDAIIVGDTLRIVGLHFGGRQAGSALLIGGRSAVLVLSWSDTLINVIVPGGAVSGVVSLTTGGRTSAIAITILPPPIQLSFLNNVRPIFLVNSCINCHGGSAALYVGTVAQLLQGGVAGPAIIPGNADGSLLIQKLSPNPPFGERMPQYGPYLSDSSVQVIRTWIDQGAKDN